VANVATAISQPKPSLNQSRLIPASRSRRPVARSMLEKAAGAGEYRVSEGASVSDKR